MTTISLPNAGIAAGFLPDEDGWSAKMNKNLRLADALMQARVVDKDLSSPPASPTAGQMWIVGPSGGAEWTGSDGKLALWQAGDDLTSGWLFITPKAGWKVYVEDESKDYQHNGSTWGVLTYGGGGGGGGDTYVGASGPNDIILAASDMATALTVGVKKAYAPAARPGVITGVKANLDTASSSGAVTIDIKKNGTSILTTLLSIDASELTSLAAATAAVLDSSKTTVAADDIVTVDITGAGTGAKGLVITLLFTVSPGISTIIENTAARDMLNSDAGSYLRFTATGAKTATFRPESVHALPADAEFTIANRGASGDLTLTFTSPAVGNVPAGGTLVLEPGMTVTVKRYAADGFDVMGQTA